MKPQPPDLVVLDDHERIVLAIEVKAKIHPLDRSAVRDSLVAYAHASGTGQPLVLLITSESMTLYEETPHGYDERSAATEDILGEYDGEFERYRTDSPYLESLVYRWLRDLIERDDTTKARGLIEPGKLLQMHIVRDPRRAA
jgi:hypothetical protein